MRSRNAQRTTRGETDQRRGWHRCRPWGRGASVLAAWVVLDAVGAPEVAAKAPAPTTSPASEEVLYWDHDQGHGTDTWYADGMSGAMEQCDATFVNACAPDECFIYNANLPAGLPPFPGALSRACWVCEAWPSVPWEYEKPAPSYSVNNLGYQWVYCWDGSTPKRTANGTFDCTATKIAPDMNGGATCPGFPAAGDPINPATGNLFLHEQDLALGGLTLSRWYNSIRPRARFSTSHKPAFGIDSHWQHSFERAVWYVDGASDYAAATRPDGNTVSFYLSTAGVWEASSATSLTLTWTQTSAGAPAGFVLRDTAGLVETYDAGGRLVALKDGADRLTLAYDDVVDGYDYASYGRLATVIAADGRVLAFHYDSSSGRLASVTTPEGSQILYDYDDAGRLIGVTHPDATPETLTDNPSRWYEYANPAWPDALTSAIDERGVVRSSWTYDASGRAIANWLGMGDNQVSVAYGPDSSTVTYAGAASYDYTFGSSYERALLTSMTGSAAAAYAYDEWGGMTSATDGRGSVTGYERGEDGRVTRVSEAASYPEARVTTYTWDVVANQLATAANDKTNVAWTYDGDGNLTSRTVSDVAAPATSSTQTLTYVAGMVTAHDGPRTDVADVTSFAYDASGQLSAVTNPAGHQLTYVSRDAAGRPVSVRSPNGRTSTFTYGPRGELTSSDDGTETTLFTYDPALHLTSAYQPSRGLWTFAWDDAARVTEAVTPEGWARRFTYDGQSRVTKQEDIDAAGGVVRTVVTTYDAEGRVATQAGVGPAETTSYVYDESDNLIAMTDGLLQTTNFRYDRLDRLTSQTGPDGATTVLAYDVNDVLASVADGRGHVTSYDVDGLLRPTRITAPDTGTTELTYDAADNPLREVDATGRVVTRSYDALNRVTSVHWDGWVDTFRYDEGSNGVGHLTSVASGDVASWTYNQQGRLTGFAQTYGGSTRTVTLARDSYQRLTTMTYPSGASVGYTYDATGQVASVTVGGAAKITSIVHSPLGVVGWTWGNGRVVSRPRNRNGQLTGYTLGADAVALEYDAAGRLTTLADPTRTRSFGYDAAGRVISATGDTAYTYTYDATGNRTTTTVNAVPSTLAIDPASNRLLQRTDSGGVVRAFAYTADGRVSSDGVHTYEYGERTNLASIDGGAWRYHYDVFHRRTAKSKSVAGGYAKGDVNHDYLIDKNDLPLLASMIAGTATRVPEADCNGDGAYTSADSTCTRTKANSDTVLFLYEGGGRLLGEYTGLGIAVREYVYFDDAPALVIQGGVVYYVDTDQLGTPRVVSNSAGQRVWSWSSDPFGVGVADTNPSGLGPFTMPLRFAGQYYDGESGLHYNMRRYYAPALGRYLQPDPIRLAGGTNLYEYVGSNPAQRVDPLGLASEGRPGNLGPLIGGVVDTLRNWDLALTGYGALPGPAAAARELVESDPALAMMNSFSGGVEVRGADDSFGWADPAIGTTFPLLTDRLPRAPGEGDIMNALRSWLYPRVGVMLTLSDPCVKSQVDFTWNRGLLKFALGIDPETLRVSEFGIGLGTPSVGTTIGGSAQ